MLTGSELKTTKISLTWNAMLVFVMQWTGDLWLWFRFSKTSCKKMKWGKWTRFPENVESKFIEQWTELACDHLLLQKRNDCKIVELSEGQQKGWQWKGSNAIIVLFLERMYGHVNELYRFTKGATWGVALKIETVFSFFYIK